MFFSIRKCLLLIGAYLAVAEVTSFWATRSLNPISVYGGGGMLSKIVVSVMLAAVVMGSLALLQIALMRGWIRALTGRPADDARCAGCGNPLLKYIGSHGLPRACPVCKRFWHKLCFLGDSSAGSPQRGMLAPCPECRKKAGKIKTPDFSEL